MTAMPTPRASPATGYHPLPTVVTPVASAVEISVNTRGAKLLPEEGSHPDQRDSRAIYLPNHVQAVSHIAVDIGGSLAKLVYFTRAPNQPGGGSPAVQAPTTSLPSALPGGRLNFVKFETEHIEDCVSFLSQLLNRSAKANGVSVEHMRRGVKLTATGGGAHMYKELFERELGIEVQREDEMGCLITGLNFITLIPDEVFWLSDELVEQSRADGKRMSLSSQPNAGAAGAASTSAAADELSALPRPSPNPPSYELQFDSSPSPKLPCLLVNIGSGVSIIRVDENGAFERVSGTSLGGGTLWGLLSLLTGAGSFDEMLALSEEGDNARVDMLVGDIYGQVGYNNLGLKSTTIASSFGKVFRRQSEEDSGEEDDDGPLKRDQAPGVKSSGPSDGEEEETRAQAEERRSRERRRKQRAFRPEDICKSLLYAISNNIGQIAYMNAEKYGLDRIYFSGCFIRGHHATINTLSYAIRFWSKGTKRALFLRHEGYLGAVGAWIRQVGGKSSAPIANGEPVSAPAGTPSVPEPAPAPAPAAAPAPAPRRAAPSQATSLNTTFIPTEEDLSPTPRAITRNGVAQTKAGDGSEEEEEEDDDDDGQSVDEEALTQQLIAAHPELAGILGNLADADGAADKLEHKLNGLLERLDGLLLEPGPPAGAGPGKTSS